MDDEQRRRVKELYGCEESIMAYLIHSGTKIGNTTKARLDQGNVEELEADP